MGVAGGSLGAPDVRHRRPPCPTPDLSDAEWAILAPLLSSPRGPGRPPKWPARRVADAVFYLLRSGCAWRMLPREYPPWPTAYYHFRRRHREGALAVAHDLLRGEVRAREGRSRDPSAAVVDGQAVKTTGVGGTERGYDGAKRLSGRKRHLLVDTTGLVLAAGVHSVGLHDRDGGRRLLSADLRGWLPRLGLVGPTAPTPAASGSGHKRSVGCTWRSHTGPPPEATLRAGGGAARVPGDPAEVGRWAHLRLGSARRGGCPRITRGRRRPQRL